MTLAAFTAETHPKFWGPILEVTDWLAARIPDGAKVLEIGPGNKPFRKATVFVDRLNLAKLPAPLHVCDVTREPLPFADKSMDFVMARHILEDVHDPFVICREIQRVGKSGYIETPSPLAEFCRGIDGGYPGWRGYHHHHWLVWVGDSGELRFASKWPLIEYLGAQDEEHLVASLRSSPRYWNSYLLWNERGFTVRHLECPKDYDICTQYGDVIRNAMLQSRASTDRFFNMMAADAAIPPQRAANA